MLFDEALVRDELLERERGALDLGEVPEGSRDLRAIVQLDLLPHALAGGGLRARPDRLLHGGPIGASGRQRVREVREPVVAAPVLERHDPAGVALHLLAEPVPRVDARPEIEFDDAAFEQFLRGRPQRLAAATPANAGDLLLAFACARGDPTAIRVVERDYLSPLGASLPARHRHDAAEVVQVLRERMLVADGQQPARIGEYSGRGELRAWLRVAAVRVALNIERSKWREVKLDEDRALAERAGGDLEIENLKRRYRTEFRGAFSAALRALGARDRTLLRQHYLDGRWMDRARTALARETRRELGARLRVDPDELESILRLIESQMEMSIRAFLERD